MAGGVFPSFLHFIFIGTFPSLFPGGGGEESSRMQSPMGLSLSLSGEPGHQPWEMPGLCMGKLIWLQVQALVPGQQQRRLVGEI